MKIKTSLEIIRIDEKHTDRKDWDTPKWWTYHDKFVNKKWVAVNDIITFMKNKGYDCPCDTLLDELNEDNNGN